LEEEEEEEEERGLKIKRYKINENRRD